MKNPVEKASEILEKYHYNFDLSWQAAKQCARIAVDEIIEAIGDFGYSNNSWENPETRKLEGWDEATKYWVEVKEAIQ